MQNIKFHPPSRFVKPLRQLHPLAILIAVSTIVLFLCSAYRHFVFYSTAYDLGIYDQAIYLISRGLPPISSFLRFHILGDHASVIYYPIALLYKLYPSVYWLFAIQSIGLAIGALPVFALARMAGVERPTALMLSVTYLLYPAIFNINLFDFHPDVLAPAALLGAVWAVRTDRLWLYCFLVLLVLSLKAPLALTVIAMGIWLALFEKKPKYGLIAIVAGTAWFLFTTQWLMPSLSGAASRGLKRYPQFGDSPLEIALNLLLKPHLSVQILFTQENLIYLGQLFLPVAWGLSPRHLAPLVGAMPALLMNLFSNYDEQKTLKNQYSLPILPFLLLSVIATIAANEHWIRYISLRFPVIKVKWMILLWAIVGFVLLARYQAMFRFNSALKTVVPLQEAIQLIRTDGSVWTDNSIAPHLSHRPVIRIIPITCNRRAKIDGGRWQYILLNKRYAYFRRSECIPRLIDLLLVHPDYKLAYKRRGIHLFVRNSTAPSGINSADLESAIEDDAGSSRNQAEQQR